MKQFKLYELSDSLKQIYDDLVDCKIKGIKILYLRRAVNYCIKIDIDARHPENVSDIIGIWNLWIATESKEAMIQHYLTKIKWVNVT